MQHFPVVSVSSQRAGVTQDSFVAFTGGTCTKGLYMGPHGNSVGERSHLTEKDAGPGSQRVQSPPTSPFTADVPSLLGEEEGH